MNFFKSELKMIYQYAAPTRAGTLDAMKKALPAVKDDLTRAIMENAVCKLQNPRSGMQAALSRTPGQDF
ncbi:MAG: transposon-transfer assisting family protein [Enterocloster sp.]